MADRLAAWFTPAALAAMGLSLAIHFFLLAIAGLWVLQRAVLSDSGVETTIELAGLNAPEETQRPEIPAVEVPFDLDLDVSSDPLELSFEADAMLGEARFGESAALDLLGGAGAGEGLQDGGLVGSGAGAGVATFFGVEGRGNKFVYIVDVSGSMDTTNEAGQRRIDVLKANLIESIDGLAPHTSFFVIAYNDRPHLMPGELKWRRGTPDNKREAMNWIRETFNAGGGTDPTGGFEEAFKFRPRPDVIYFMTDGQNAEGLPMFVDQLNQEGARHTRINCIAFGSNESEEIMRRIARDSGGTYRYVP